MACPYFIPLRRVEADQWPHPALLPLGAGWQGCCGAEGGKMPVSHQQARDFCNLGYAGGCPRLPAGRDADSVRFMARRADGRVTVEFCCERAHLPVAHGKLEFDVAAAQWLNRAGDERVQRLAERYLEVFLEKHSR